LLRRRDRGGLRSALAPAQRRLVVVDTFGLAGDDGRRVGLTQRWRPGGRTRLLDRGGLGVRTGLVGRHRAVEAQGRVAHRGGVGGHGVKSTGSAGGGCWHRPVSIRTACSSSTRAGCTSTTMPVPPVTAT